jgi:NadR type nicotinamide-nucleotide adenylyltransferase
VLEAPDGPEDTGSTLDIQLLHEEFLIRFLAGRQVDAFYSSEPYGAQVSLALGCVDRRVDEARLTWPVSGTVLRKDPGLRERFLDPPVRADLVRRIVLLGGPSTGKTALALALTDRLKEPWCPEFGREYWVGYQVDHRLSMEDLETIACGQAVAERRTALVARAVLVADSCPLTTLAYARYHFGQASASLERLVDEYLMLPRSYWLCGDEIPVKDRPDRSSPPSHETIQRLIIADLEARGLSYRVASGSLKRRIDAVYTSESEQRGI